MDIQAVLPEEPRFFGNPDRGERAGLRAVAYVHLLHFQLSEKRSDRGEKEDESNDADATE
jgi:hypothetical protein